jgi:carbon-monoxide dehydrogenase medium subunit
MKAAPFDYHRPLSADAAVLALAELGDEAKVLAGGQSLVPVMAMRLGRPEHIVDINRIGELAGATRSGGTLRVGALARHRELEHDPLIIDQAGATGIAARRQRDPVRPQPTCSTAPSCTWCTRRRGYLMRAPASMGRVTPVM